MKKIFVITSILVASLVSAQKGTLLVGGNLSLTSEKTEDGSVESKTSTSEFIPTIGYQFNDNWTAGIQTGISNSKTELNNVDTQDVSSFAIGGFVRYSKALNETFAVYGDLGAGYLTAKNKLSKVDGNGMYIGLTPALFINFKNSFGLNFSIGGISYSTLSLDGGSDSSTFDFNFGKTVNIGISKNFKL